MKIDREETKNMMKDLKKARYSFPGGQFSEENYQ
jgi:hypothetical protein